MARMSISVPDDLRRRIEETEQSVNWSQLAARAFEEKLAELAARKKELEMAAVIARLKLSKSKQQSAAHREGFSEGQYWAERKAELAELQRLSDLRETQGWGHLFDEETHSAYDVGELVAFEILALADDHDRQAARDFWNEVLDSPERSSEAEFIEGFCDGALDIYNKVADLL